MRVFILHPGKATYPEIQAYKSYFSDRYEVLDGTISDYTHISDKENIILWCIMGFYPKTLPAGYVVHDYRSLSVGGAARVKDLLKKYISPKPSLRIFQNIEIQNVMDFKDGIPSIFLPMGIPDWLLDKSFRRNEIIGKYCYIGVINRERKLHTVIDAFLKNTPEDEMFILAGPAEKEILADFSEEPRILFTGLISQREATTIVSQCEYAICKIPQKYPYNYQMPTKFLEYAALGKTIICNDSPSNRMAHRAINSKVIFTSNDIFDQQSPSCLPVSINKTGAAIEEMTWSKVIGSSGILDFL